MTVEDEACLLRLEEQVEHNGGGAWDYLCLARRFCARRPTRPRPPRRPCPPQQCLRVFRPRLRIVVVLQAGGHGGHGLPASQCGKVSDVFPAARSSSSIAASGRESRRFSMR